MANLTITATQILAASTGVDSRTLPAAVAITAGQTVYENASGQWDLADANASATTAACKGIALNGAAAGQPVKAHTGGDITLGAGAAPVVGTIYVLSATAGAIAPAADLATGHYVVILGVGKTGNILAMPATGPVLSGQVVP